MQINPYQELSGDQDYNGAQKVIGNISLVFKPNQREKEVVMDSRSISGQSPRLSESKQSLFNHDKCITKSYQPPNPPTFSKEELDKFAVVDKDIRRDEWNMRFDASRQMYIYLHEDHPDYRKYPEPEPAKENDDRWGCAII